MFDDQPTDSFGAEAEGNLFRGFVYFKGRKLVTPNSYRTRDEAYAAAGAWLKSLQNRG